MLLLLSPQIPLLFMGEEWGSTTPFQFFTDHTPELAALVREGRRQEFARFPAFADPATRARIPDPNDPATLLASIPDPVEAGRPAGRRASRRIARLLALRARHVVPGLPGCRSQGARAVGPGAVRAAWRLGDGAELTIAVNLAATPAPIAPAAGEILCATPAAAGAAVRDGRLPPQACAVFLDRPAA